MLTVITVVFLSLQALQQLPHTGAHVLTINKEETNRSGIPNEVDNAHPSGPIILTDYIDRGEPQQGRALCRAHGLPLIYQDSYAAFFNVNRTLGNHLFFWFFPSLHHPSTAPLVVWLNGGPAVSSMQGVLWENGPISTEPSLVFQGYYRVRHRHFSWADHFSMLYIDSPVGTGYSYTESPEHGYRTSAAQTADDLYNFLGQFYKVFPEYQTRELYIGGQSYAGKYVTHLGYRIHQEIQAGHSDLPLTGIYLGGPFLHPAPQLTASLEGLFDFGAISDAQLETHKTRVLDYDALYKSGGMANSSFMQVFTDIFGLEVVFSHGLDNYITGEIVNDVAITQVMGSEPFRQALHVGNDLTFSNWNPVVYDSFGGDLFESVLDKLATLMDNYKILVFDGDYDLTVPHSGTEGAILQINWTRAEEYRATHYTIWRDLDQTGMPVGDIKGYFAAVGQFCRATVKGAGHQVPRDQPGTTLALMSDFISHGCVRMEGG